MDIVNVTAEPDGFCTWIWRMTAVVAPGTVYFVDAAFET
jgi:hypothetical protein